MWTAICCNGTVTLRSLCLLQQIYIAMPPEVKARAHRFKEWQMNAEWLCLLQRIYIALPEEKARAHMFKVHLGDTPHNLEAADYAELGKRTEGFSGSDVAVVVKDVLMEPVRQTQEAGFFRCVNLWLCWQRQSCSSTQCVQLHQTATHDLLTFAQPQPRR